MLNAIQWNSELIRRYDLSGPRYTSYPTATQFHSKISSFDLIQALNQSKSKKILYPFMYTFLSAPMFATTVRAISS